MATIRKRGDLQWEVQVRRKGFPAQTKTFLSKKDAELWASTIESEIGRGVFIDRNEAEKWTLGEIVEKFTKEFAPLHYKVRPDGKEAWRFQAKHLNEALGKYSLAAVDQKLTTKYRDDRLKKVAGSTVRKELFLLSKILGFAEHECGINLPRGNPIEKIRKPSESKSRDRRLTPSEWEALELECRNSRNRLLWPAVSLAVETAMRQGELLNLKWEDVDLKRKFVYLGDTKNGEARAVPLSPVALDVLKSIPRSISGEVLSLERLTLLHAFQGARKRAKISNFTFHDLRHEALSRLAERGDFSLIEMAAVSGHKTLQMLKRYTHLQAEKLADKLANQPSC